MVVVTQLTFIKNHVIGDVKLEFRVSLTMLDPTKQVCPILKEKLLTSMGIYFQRLEHQIYNGRRSLICSFLYAPDKGARLKRDANHFLLEISACVHFIKKWWAWETDLSEINKTVVMLIPKIKAPKHTFTSSL
ncbi:hypothetical protein V2J09_006441 [Rumex salicifolius]